MLLASSIDWTTVIVTAIPTVPATLAAFVALINRRNLTTPSGEPIGVQVEKAHHLANTTSALVQQIANGGATPGQK